MKQYTTPTIEWVFKHVNLSLVETMRFVIKDEAGNTVEVTDPEVNRNVVTVKLTQEQTSSLQKGKVYMQLHWKMYDGTVDASEVESIELEELLKGESL